MPWPMRGGRTDGWRSLNRRPVRPGTTSGWIPNLWSTSRRRATRLQERGCIERSRRPAAREIWPASALCDALRRVGSQEEPEPPDPGLCRLAHRTAPRPPPRPRRGNGAIAGGWPSRGGSRRWIDCGRGPYHGLHRRQRSDPPLQPLRAVSSPSLHEGFGLPALEAMSCGAPVIGGNLTSLPEVIGWPEAMFDPLDVASMSAKIGRALTDMAFRSELIVVEDSRHSGFRGTRVPSAPLPRSNGSTHVRPPGESRAAQTTTFPGLVRELRAIPGSRRSGLHWSSEGDRAEPPCDWSASAPGRRVRVRSHRRQIGHPACRPKHARVAA